MELYNLGYFLIAVVVIMVLVTIVPLCIKWRIESNKRADNNTISCSNNYQTNGNIYDMPPLPGFYESSYDIYRNVGIWSIDTGSSVQWDDINVRPQIERSSGVMFQQEGSSRIVLDVVEEEQEETIVLPPYEHPPEYQQVVQKY